MTVSTDHLCGHEFWVRMYSSPVRKQRKLFGNQHMIRFIIPYPKTASGKKQWAKEYGLNAYWAGKHWSKRKVDAEYWHLLVRSEMRKQLKDVQMFSLPVEIEFKWNDRLDLSNHTAMAKMIEDALRGSVIQDDSRRYVKRITHAFHNEPYIEVSIRELRES